MIRYKFFYYRDSAQKLNFAFDVYDLDNNGYLDPTELKTVIFGMLDMLGADRKAFNTQTIASEVIKDLDVSHDGKVSKGITNYVKKL